MSTTDDPLEQASRSLYSGPRATFVDRRKALAAAIRRDGDRVLAHRVLAQEVTGLRKPSVAAHSVNLLAHAGDEHFADLLELGAQIRAAFAAGDDAHLRELLQQRNAAVAATTAQARAMVRAEGESVSASVADQIVQTLRAAMATDEASAEVRRGVLTDALDEPGFAALGVGPAATPRSANPKPAAATDASRRNAKRDSELAEAEAAASAAVDEVVERSAVVAERHRELQTARDELVGRLASIERELAEVERSQAAAEKERRRAERVLETARRARRG